MRTSTGKAALLTTLVTVSCLATTNAADQSFGVISKLRGFSTTTYDQQQGYNSISSYRRLDATEDDASDQANQVGASVRKAIKQLRGGTDKFYQDLITAAKIRLCEEDVATNSVRFVSCDADNAYTDDNGDEMKLPITSLTDDETVQAYGQGLCEVSPNCYWAEIVDGDTSRARVYADDDSTMNSSAADAKIKEWLTGVIGFVIPGVVLGVLSLLTMVFFMICRCCCNRCGGRFPREEGYTCMQKFLPLLFFLLFAIGVVVVSAAAFLYRGTMLTAVDDIFNATSGTLENGSDWIVSIRTPLEKIAATVVDSAANVNTKLQNTDFIDTGLTHLTTQLSDINNECTGRKFPTSCVPDTSNGKTSVDANGNPCFVCKPCDAVGAAAKAASDQITANAGPGVKDLSTTKSQLTSKLVDISGTVQSSVDTQVTTSNDLIATVEATQADVNDYDKNFQGYRDQLGYAIMGLFALALVVIVIGFIGILFGLTPLKVLANVMHIAYFLGFIALFLTFIISAIVLAIGVMLGDACEITMVFSSNWTVPLGESAKAVDACFQNESLLDVFNLSSKLDFARGGIEFPVLNMDSMFDFSELETFKKEAKKIDASSFGFDAKTDDTFTTLQNTFKSYSAQSQSNTACRPNNIYTEVNLLVPWLDNKDMAHSDGQTALQFINDFYKTNWDTGCTGGDGNYGKTFVCVSGSPCLFSKFMGERYKELYDMATVKKGIADFVSGLKQDVSDLTTSTDSFETNTRNLNTGIDNIKADLDSHLIEYVGDFEEAMHCTFIADGFWTVYNALCGDLMPAITMIALMLFLCGIFLIPVNVCLIIGVKRLKAHGNGHIMDTEMKFK